MHIIFNIFMAYVFSFHKNALKTYSYADELPCRKHECVNTVYNQVTRKESCSNYILYILEGFQLDRDRTPGLSALSDEDLQKKIYDWSVSPKAPDCYFAK